MGFWPSRIHRPADRRLSPYGETIPDHRVLAGHSYVQDKRRKPLARGIAGDGHPRTTSPSAKRYTPSQIAKNLERSWVLELRSAACNWCKRTSDSDRRHVIGANEPRTPIGGMSPMQTGSWNSDRRYVAGASPLSLPGQTQDHARSAKACPVASMAL